MPIPAYRGGWTAELATLLAMQIEITEEPDTFIACLTLGTLRAIRVGALASDAGIWSLTEPVVWAREFLAGHVHEELLDVLGACDELSAIGDVLGHDYLDEVVDSLMERVTAFVAQDPERYWTMRWAGDIRPGGGDPP
jgi:hypothetical protein